MLSTLESILTYCIRIKFVFVLFACCRWCYYLLVGILFW